MGQTAVLVPVYNEAAVVGGVLAELRPHFDLVVVVDDGSRDGSGDVARAAGAVVVSHPVNLGQGGALRTGFELLLRTRPQVSHVVTFDADGQHDVRDALAMLATAQEHDVDVVLGSRTAGAAVGQSVLRRTLLRVGLRVSRWHSGLALSDTHNGLRVLNRRALQVLTLRQRGMAHASEIEALISRHRLSWREHPVTITYSDYARAKGQSSLNAVNILFDLVAARLHSTS